VVALKSIPSIKDFILLGHKYFMPGMSIDNVIIGFHDNRLKVLLLQTKLNEKWVLPGGHIQQTEELEEAAKRILSERTGLKEIYLQQFHVFGSTSRTKENYLKEAMHHMGVEVPDDSWLLQRFITIGFYALVEYAKVTPKADDLSEKISWWDLEDLPELLFDHKEIIQTAIKDMRLKINHQPIGYNLLPREFTLKNLQSIYEAILDKKLDRANFNRKILSYGILDKKEKHYTGGAHKAPYLYSFNKKAYFQALQHGLEKTF
jgi:ADP-ribose pyrophosphatase YjhB (NUDIX family)